MNVLKAGSHTLQLQDRTHIMGILNVTPDSFSDGGRFVNIDTALAQVEMMVLEGADIIDIGGESTRPGAQTVEKEKELERVLPIIEAVSDRFDIPISIDTYKAEVAQKAILAGAHIINDVWGAKKDPTIAQIAAQSKVPIILMHNRTNKSYINLMGDMVADLQESVSIAQQAGVEQEQIILDPGIGFGKTYEHNLEIMRSLETITALGYPVLLGTSRKSMIGTALDLPPSERMEGTLATICLGITKGCQIVRVHDVKAASRAVRMMDAMLGEGALVEHG